MTKHPHGRGEELIAAAPDMYDAETPPRAWGRVDVYERSVKCRRNTPTGVGKSLREILHQQLIWKHPHGRGEETASIKSCTTCAETPPRAWGRAPKQSQLIDYLGNTPTGVGKRLSDKSCGQVDRKHPHGRGEESGMIPESRLSRETPPRAWGREHTQISNNLSIIAYFFHLSKSSVRSVLIFL